MTTSTAPTVRPCRPTRDWRHPNARARSRRGRARRDPGVARRVAAARTALLYLWGLGASGYGNDFYAAAVQAGTQELEGVLLRLLRLGEPHHVDKPPAVALADGISGRIFGFNSWSMLAPQAIEGVLTVGSCTPR